MTKNAKRMLSILMAAIMMFGHLPDRVHAADGPAPTEPAVEQTQEQKEPETSTELPSEEPEGTKENPGEPATQEQQPAENPTTAADPSVVSGEDAGETTQAADPEVKENPEETQEAQIPEESQQAEVPEESQAVEETTESAEEPSESAEEPTESEAEPTQPEVEPTEPVVEPTEPVVEPTEPVVEPTEPVVEPTEPVVEPTEPVVEPTEPVENPDNTIETEKQIIQSGAVSINGELPVNGSVVANLQITLNPIVLPGGEKTQSTGKKNNRTSATNESDLVSYDITILDENGERWQPEQPVLVTIADESFLNVSKVSVYHVNEKGDRELVAKDIVPVNGTVTFKAEHFSVYVVVDQGQDARLLVHFVGLNGAEIASMYVKSGDNMEQVLYDPGAGTLANGVYFRGWTTDPDYTPATTAKTIAQVRTDVAGMLPPAHDGEEVTYYAMLFKDYRVTYLDENGISLGQEEVTFRADSTTDQQSYKVNMAYTVQNENYHFEGWNVHEGGSNIVGHTEGTKYQNNQTITITGDVQFSVFAPEGHWFIFDQNGKGATYNAPQFVYSGQKPTRPNDADMIRNGYTFGGWFEDKAIADQTSGGTEYNFNQTLTDKVTVYARWIPNTTAAYTIIIWKQNLAGDGYDFVESISKTGNVNSVINTVRQQGSGNDAYAQVQRTNGNQWSDVRYTGFHLKEFDQNVVIKTEGNSVLNIYYNRNQHTLKFQVQKSGWVVATDNEGTQYRDQNWNQVYYNSEDGKWYRNRSWSGGYYTGHWNYSSEYTGTRYKYLYNEWTTIKEINALYGQSISDQFPIVGTDNVTYTAARWDPQSSTPYDEVLSYIDIMPNADVVFHRDNGGPGQGNYKNIYYYVEALPGETGPTVSYNGKTFVEYKHLECNYYFFTEAEDYLELTGYTKYGVDPDSGAWGSGGASTVKCYYTRNTYVINFMDGKYVNGDNNPLEETGMGQIATQTGISYGANVSSYNSYTPDAAHTPSGYVFEGWFIDSACTQEYTFNKMPEGGITVYAKWRQKQYRVFLHVNYPEGATGNINWGTNNQQMTFRISEGGHVSEPTRRDLAGYAFDGWYLDEACTQVFNGEAYVINESNVTTPYDKTVDMTDTYDNNGNLIDPKSNSDATGYNGGDRFWITTKLDIYAKWHSTLEGASGIVVEYDANGGTGAPIDTHTYVDKAKAPAGAASRSSDPTKVFAYWEVQKWENGAWVGTGTKVLPGQTFEVLKANAKVEDLATPAANGDTKKYTVQLKAVYIDSEQPTPTHISWFRNDGTAAFHTDILVNGENALEINEAVAIQGAPSRDGYVFLGWSRVPISTSDDPATAAQEAETWENTDSNWTQDLTTPNLLFYNADDGFFYREASFTNKAEFVAADEDLPYHALFAVWQPKLQVRITGSTATKPYNGSEQSVTGYTVEYKVGDGDWTTTAPEGVSVDLATGVTAEAKGTNVNTDPGYPMGLTKESFTVSAANYVYNEDNDLTVVDGWLKITKKAVTITINGSDDTKVYNGSEQTSETTVTPNCSDSLFDASKFSYTGATTITKTNVGEYSEAIDITKAAYDDANLDVTFTAGCDVHRRHAGDVRDHEEGRDDHDQRFWRYEGVQRKRADLRDDGNAELQRQPVRCFQVQLHRSDDDHQDERRRIQRSDRHHEGGI